MSCVVLGVTGGIAAYKSAEIVSRFRKLGIDVYVVMTAHATEFVSPLTFETLSNHPVAVDMFRRETPWEVEHIALAKRADLFLVAPATANLLGKLAHGIADDMLTTTLLATRAPVLLAPAMNTGMLENAATQENMGILKSRGIALLGPEAGMLACGDEGAGRMSSPEAIVEKAMVILRKGKNLAERCKLLVTAGPTREPLDPVRFLSNRSSGKMGYAIATEAASRGWDVCLVSGPVALPQPLNVDRVWAETAQDMLEAVAARANDSDIIIKAAAPADYRLKEAATQKMKKKNGEPFVLEMSENSDIAAMVGRRKKDEQVLVVFAAETERLMEHAAQKLQKKNADLLVANDVTMPGAGFDVDTNIVTLLTPNGNKEDLPLLPKREVAARILDKAYTLWKEKQPEGKNE